MSVTAFINALEARLPRDVIVTSKDVSLPGGKKPDVHFITARRGAVEVSDYFDGYMDPENLDFCAAYVLRLLKKAEARHG